MTAIESAARLAWVPFLEPIDLHGYWLVLAVPLSFGIALVYKTLRLPTLDGLAGQALRLTATILLCMAAAAVALWGLTELA